MTIKKIKKINGVKWIIILLKYLCIITLIKNYYMWRSYNSYSMNFWTSIKGFFFKPKESFSLFHICLIFYFYHLILYLKKNSDKAKTEKPFLFSYIIRTLWGGEPKNTMNPQERNNGGNVVTEGQSGDWSEARKSNRRIAVAKNNNAMRWERR